MIRVAEAGGTEVMNSFNKEYFIMATIKPIALPSGASTRYQYFRNEETGNEWKALLEIRTARRAMLPEADVETAPTELAIFVTVSPINEEGRAVIENDKPIVIDGEGWHFTVTEMAAEGFDPLVTAVNLVAKLIDIGEASVTGRQKINNLGELWQARAMLQSEPVTVSVLTPIEEGSTDGNANASG